MLQSLPVIVTGSQIPNVLFDEEVGLQHKAGGTSQGGRAPAPVAARATLRPLSPAGPELAASPGPRLLALTQIPRGSGQSSAVPQQRLCLPSLLPKPPLPQRAARGLARRSSARPSPAVGLCAVPASCRSREPGRTHHLSPSGPHVLLLCQPVLILRVGCVLQ